MFGQLASGVLQIVRNPVVFFPVRMKHTVFQMKGGWADMPVKKKLRFNFPRPSETKRVKVSGYAKRMSTLSGRKIIMRRILKGYTVLAS